MASIAEKDMTEFPGPQLTYEVTGLTVAAEEVVAARSHTGPG